MSLDAGPQTIVGDPVIVSESGSDVFRGAIDHLLHLPLHGGVDLAATWIDVVEDEHVLDYRYAWGQVGAGFGGGGDEDGHAHHSRHGHAVQEILVLHQPRMHRVSDLLAHDDGMAGKVCGLLRLAGAAPLGQLLVEVDLDLAEERHLGDQT